MARRTGLRAALVLATCLAALVPAILLAPSAGADCAYDPDAMTIRQMIRGRTTGDKLFDVLFIGRVRSLHDLGGKQGGQILAKFRVRVHPAGFASERSRVRFYNPRHGDLIPNFEFHRGHRYAVVAHRKNTGVFAFDGACGQTTKLSRQRMRKLIRLFWHS